MDFVAVFCRRCGECVNEPAEADVGGGRHVRPVLGVMRSARLESVTCFWCKRRHSIDQVVLCRNLAHVTEAQRMEGALRATERGLLALRERMRAPIFYTFGATVMNAGGGWVQMVIDETTPSYPKHGAHVMVTVDHNPR